MDVKKFDYTDLIDFDCKNQTAKLLENYFHRMRNEEYDSIVAVEEETYTEQPFFEFAEHINEKENQDIVNRTVQYVKQFILNVAMGNDFNVEVFKTYLYNLDPFFDKALAFNIATLLNEKDVFASEFDFETAWMSCGIKLRNQSTQESDSKEDTTVDTSKLVIGKTVKNYKVLCELLGQEVKDGKDKKVSIRKF